jgi:hypothetical protein
MARYSINKEIYKVVGRKEEESIGHGVNFEENRNISDWFVELSKKRRLGS